MKQIIVTADDFGLCEEVNDAVEIAHRAGILSAASLMVSAPAAKDAIGRALRLPSLRVGLHIVLVDGRPILPPDEIPELVDTNGAFPNDLVRAGVRWFLSTTARRQLEREVRAQFDAFRSTGLAFDHVNAHNHMHVHPTVLGIVLRLASMFGVPFIRLPFEPPALRRSGAPRLTISERLAVLSLAPWLRFMRRRIEHAGLRHNDTLLGLRNSGHLNEASLLELLSQLPEGITELYFHPAIRRTPQVAAMMPGYDNEAEFAALTSTLVSDRLRTLGLKAIGFADVK
jgi:hopanoid biosynthesis associated protein HpnK